MLSGRVTYHHEARKPPLPPPQEGVEGLCGGPHTQENVVAVVTPGKGRVVVGREGVVRDGVSRLPVALMVVGPTSDPWWGATTQGRGGG